MFEAKDSNKSSSDEAKKSNKTPVVLDFGETHPDLEKYYSPEAVLNKPSRQMMKSGVKSPQAASTQTGPSSNNNIGESLDSGFPRVLKESNSAGTFQSPDGSNYSSNTSIVKGYVHKKILTKAEEEV